MSEDGNETPEGEDLKATLAAIAAAMSNMQELLMKKHELGNNASHQSNENLENVRNNNQVITTFVPPKPQLPAVILNEDSDYESWLLHTRNELKAFQLEHLVFENVTVLKEMSEEVETAARAWLLTYLSARVAETYRRTLTYSKISTPVDFIHNLQQIKNPVSELTAAKALRTWASITYAPDVTKESVEAFILRFNEAEMRVNKFSHKKLTQQEIVNYFVIATSDKYPEMLYYKSTKGDNLTLLDAQAYFRQIASDHAEAKLRAAEAKPGAALSAEEIERKKKEIRCFKCNRTGHTLNNCYSNSWYCFNCKIMHGSEGCPAAKNVETGNIGSYRGRARGREPYIRGFRSRRGRGGIRFRGSRARGSRNLFTKVKVHGPDNKVSYGYVALADMEIEEERSYYNQSSNDNDDYMVCYGENTSENSNENEEKVEAQMAVGKSNDNSIQLICDSGATEHLVNSLECLTNISNLPIPITIQSANVKAPIQATKTGTIITQLQSGKIVKIKDILYASKLTKNLLSVRKLVQNGVDVVLSNSSVKIIDSRSQKVVKSGTFDGRFWYISFTPFTGRIVEKVECFVNEGVENSGNNNDNNYGNLKGAPADSPIVTDHNYARKCCDISEEGSKADDCVVLNEHNYSKKTVASPSDTNSSVDVASHFRDDNNVASCPQDGDRELNKDTNKNEGSIVVENNERQQSNDQARLLSSKELQEYLNAAKEIESGSGGTGRNLLNNVENSINNLGMLWHVRLSHVSLEYLKQMAKIVPELNKVKFEKDILKCEICILAKQTAEPCKDVRHRYAAPLRLVHTDVMGPIRPPTVRKNSKYVVTFVDDYTRYAWAYPIGDKMSVHICLRMMLSDARKLLGNEVKLYEIRLDNGTEYETENMKRLIQEEKIIYQKSPAYTSNHNGTAERFNRDIQEKMRSLIIDAGFPKTMWAFALEFALKVYNNTPHRSIDFAIPYEMLAGKKVSLKYFRRFGSLCYVLNPLHQDKFNERGREGFLVGCADSYYLIVDPTNGKIIKSKNVRFIENRVYGHIYGQKRKDSVLGESTYRISDNKKSAILRDPEEPIGDVLDDVRAHFSSILNNTTNHTDNSRLDNFSDIVDALLSDINNCPKSYDAAIKGPNSEQWKIAIRKELYSQEKNKTWEYVLGSNVPARQRILTSHWLFNIKNNYPNDTTLYKARLVIRGFEDNNIYKLQEIYSPVARLSDIKVLLCIAVKFDLHIQQMDVTTAFLNGELEQDVYMEVPEGIDTVNRFTHVCKLRKALYGLCISPKRWYTKFKEIMLKLNFTVYPFQSCIFMWSENGKKIFVLLYVDDILIVGNCLIVIDKFKKHLQQFFEMKDLGFPSKFIGLELERVGRTIFIHQKKIINKLLNKVGMSNCKPCSTPMVPGSEKISNSMSTIEEVTPNYPFREVVGTLLYLASGSRLDIAYSVNVVSRRQTKFNNTDIMKIKRILRFLKGSIDRCLKIDAQGENLECFVDSSLGADYDGGSTCGWIIMLFGDVISWSAKRQRHIALSSAEAEYVSMS